MNGKNIRGSATALERSKTGVQSKENLDISNSSTNELPLAKQHQLAKQKSMQVPSHVPISKHLRDSS